MNPNKPQIPEDKLAVIKELLLQARKIEAIKIFRETTGTGLTEAKAAVDVLEKQLRETNPTSFHPSTERRGCLWVVIVLCVLIAVAILYFRV